MTVDRKPQGRSGWIIALCLALACSAIGLILYGWQNGLGTFMGAVAAALSLVGLDFILSKAMASKMAKPGTIYSILGAFIRWPIVLALLAMGATLSKPHFGPYVFGIVLVYFAIVIGVFARRNADPIHNK